MPVLNAWPKLFAGEWRRSDLGELYFYKYKEHLLPKELQKEVENNDQPADIASFDPKLEEWHL